MNEAPALREPFVIYAIASLAIAVVLLTAGWVALVRRPAPWLPMGAAVVLGLAYTLFPDLRGFSIAWDVLFLLLFHVVVIYALATFLGSITGDALHRREVQLHQAATEDAPSEAPVARPEDGSDEADEPRRSRAAWLPAFRASWYRPGAD
ncbi:MAG: hypothetical protein GX134_08215 [candidate division WS1 bacterium]|jgi:hypothetical protein|nr:hypothetical protein [candidate division WS1 bacterium]